MKNLFKKSLRNSKYLLVFFLFGCHLINPEIDPKLTAPITIKKQPKPIEQRANNQFESRELTTAKINKKKVKVALFLPFSGKNKELGWHLFNAATLALFDNDVNNNIELVLVDSKDTPQEAAKAFKEIIDKDIKVVIGPVFTPSIEAIEADVKANKIIIISLSNNQKLMGKVTNNSAIFLSGMMPETQVEKIVSYALGKEKTNFAIIAPNTQYGLTITDLLKRTVKARDGNFIVSEVYQPNGRDLDKTVLRVINSFTVPSRLAEGKGNKGKLNKTSAVSDNDHSYPQVIMIPDSGKALSQIVASIQNQNKDEREFQIIGTSQWDDISTLNDLSLSGAWFAAPENEKFRKLEKSYYGTYNKFPPRLASIAYDSVAVVVEMIDRKNGKNIEVADLINYNANGKNGFDGIDGLFRFLPNGLVQRNLAVLEVRSGRFDTIEKPVEKFLKY